MLTVQVYRRATVDAPTFPQGLAKRNMPECPCIHRPTHPVTITVVAAAR
jgi:hypothetical protein